MNTLPDCNEDSPLRLSLEELQAFQGFENIDEAEANQIIASLYQLAYLATNINN